MAWKAKVLRLSDREHKTRGTSAERGYGHAWRKARQAYLMKHPICLLGLTHVVDPMRPITASVVDHIEPHRGDQELFWDVANWQACCKRCHDAKTASGR
jgi:5-methylcytosine-specific restriction protein A